MRRQEFREDILILLLYGRFSFLHGRQETALFLYEFSRCKRGIPDQWRRKGDSKVCHLQQGYRPGRKDMETGGKTIRYRWKQFPQTCFNRCSDKGRTHWRLQESRCRMWWFKGFCWPGREFIVRQEIQDRMWPGLGWHAKLPGFIQVVQWI